jgi:tetratricopeptide (TPR) repeat protein
MRGHSYWSQNDYLAAVTHMKKAIELQPKFGRAQKEIGKTYYRLSELAQNMGKSRTWALEAKSHLLQADRINPYDIDTAYSLALVAFHMEKINKSYGIEIDTAPISAKIYFEKAVRLSPNVAFYRIVFARYLHAHGKTDELMEVVRSITTFYPRAYFDLSKSSYWSQAVREAAKLGLETAVADKISTKNAHEALAALHSEMHHWEEAIYHYQRMLELSRLSVTQAQLIHIGALFLQSGDLSAAKKQFRSALQSSELQNETLSKIFSFFQQENLVEEFIVFHQQMRDELVLYPESDLFVARALLDLKQPDNAIQLLTDLLRQKPSGEGYYLLYQAAELKKDVDSMELAIQKACVLEPDNHLYRQYFFNLLRRLKRFKRLEGEITKVIERSGTPPAYYFDERAQLKMKQNHYLGAISDWQAAIRIDPNIDAYYYNTAEAYMKLGELKTAISYYKKAASVTPDNARYLNKIAELQGG